MPDDGLGQVLDWAVRLCAISQLVGLLELALARRELVPGGFLDWTLIGVLSPQTRTGFGSLIRRVFRRIGPRLFKWTLLIDGAVATLLLARPSAAPLIAIAWIMQLLIMKRHHLTFDGSDHMTLVVLLACLLGRVESDPVAERAAVIFLAAEVSLAYLAAGLYKATSPYWQSGQAIPMVVQTRMFGRVAAARLVRHHSRARWPVESASLRLLAGSSERDADFDCKATPGCAEGIQRSRRGLSHRRA